MSQKGIRRRSKFKSAQCTGSSKSCGRLLTTYQHIQLARRRQTTVEAYMVLIGGLRATHWLTYIGWGNYIGEVIDSDEYETTADEFAKTYAWVGDGAVWHLDGA